MGGDEENNGSWIDLRLWGKSRGLPQRYPVICHLLDTAAVAGVIFDLVVGPSRGRWLAEKLAVSIGEARDLVMLWAGLHDLGKICPPFQAKEPGAYADLTADPGYEHNRLSDSDRRFQHDEASQWILSELFPSWGYPSSQESSGPQIAQMLGGHHGRFYSALDDFELARPRVHRAQQLGRESWAAQARAHAEAVASVIGAGARVVPGRGRLRGEAIAVLMGIVVCADWLASQEDFLLVPGRLPAQGWAGLPTELRRHWEAAGEDAVATVQASGLGPAEFVDIVPGTGGWRQRFPAKVYPFSPNPLQESLAERLPDVARGCGLLLVTAPTGDGKTEAALFAAAHMAKVSGVGGIAFALPTMATTDAMFPRIQAFADANLQQDAALALVHSMSWLNTNFESLAMRAVGGSPVLTGGGGAAIASDWLRGGRRGLLAPLGAMTIDQALCAVLPTRHNMLRLHGLSGKVLVIDEAHSYGPWMHTLMCRLLEWLGALRTPVVVMSATLTGRISRSLVNAYRRGAGFKTPTGIELAYPGWLFVDAATGEACPAVPVGTDRAYDLAIEVVPVHRDEAHGTSDRSGSDNPTTRHRDQVLVDVLGQVPAQGGCVLVCCNTVPEAQSTYALLRAEFQEHADGPVEVTLLHSRFRAKDRARITAACEAAFGKPGPDGTTSERPHAAILVATQIIEQSIDLDFDLVVSDLAPLALLLQRAGRCQRHRRTDRNRWAAPGPRLIVLDPVAADGSGFQKPGAWGSVYFESLLRRTSILLNQRAEAPVSVPGDVQDLVDAVYAEDFVQRIDQAEAEERAALDAADSEQLAVQAAENQLAKTAAIRGPAAAGNLAVYSGEGPNGLTDEALVTTRLGADSARLVLAYRKSDGALALDEDGAELPGWAGSGKLSVSEVRAVMEHSVPVPGTWVRGRDFVALPTSWRDHALLRDLVVIEGYATADRGWQASQAPELAYRSHGAGMSRARR